MSADAKTKLMSLGVLLVVFVAGAVLGAAFDESLGAEPAGVTAEADSRDGSADSDSDDDRSDDRRRQSMWERTDPNEVQRMTIDSIIDHHRDRLRTLQAEFREAYNPRYWAIVDSTRSSIREVLGPDQRMQYDSMTTAYDARRRDRNRWDPND